MEVCWEFCCRSNCDWLIDLFRRLLCSLEFLIIILETKPNWVTAYLWVDTDVGVMAPATVCEMTPSANTTNGACICTSHSSTSCPSGCPIYNGCCFTEDWEERRLYLRACHCTAEGIHEGNPRHIARWGSHWRRTREWRSY